MVTCVSEEEEVIVKVPGTNVITPVWAFVVDELGVILLTYHLPAEAEVCIMSTNVVEAMLGSVTVSVLPVVAHARVTPPIYI